MVANNTIIVVDDAGNTPLFIAGDVNTAAIRTNNFAQLVFIINQRKTVFVVVGDAYQSMFVAEFFESFHPARQISDLQ